VAAYRAHEGTARYASQDNVASSHEEAPKTHRGRVSGAQLQRLYEKLAPGPVLVADFTIKKQPLPEYNLHKGNFNRAGSRSARNFNLHCLRVEVANQTRNRSGVSEAT